MFIIRADGNAKIGAGHMMRCLTIADALGRQMEDGRKILFVCADGQSAELARNRGYEAFALESGTGRPEAELPLWHRIPGIEKEPNEILVDSYFVTDWYLREIGKYGRVTLLDDMGVKCFPVSRIINYNAFADRPHYEQLYRNTDAELVLGSAYVPLRPQFYGKSYCVRERAEDILITTGGGDNDNIAGRILKRLETAAGDGIDYHLVIGNFNPHFEEMRALEESHSNIHIHHNVRDMAGLMGQCDLAVTAGGSTVYELAALGVPFVCFSYAENQEKLTDFLGREGIALSAGAYHKDPDGVLNRITEQVTTLIGSRELRDGCHSREKKLTDGLGAERLAGVLAAGQGE